MKGLPTLLEPLQEYQRIKQAITEGKTPISVTGMADAHKSHFIASLAAQMGRRALVVVRDENTAMKMAQDIGVLSGQPAHYYPARDFVLMDVDGASAEYEHQRLKVLSGLLRGQVKTVVASVEAVSQLTIPHQILERSVLTIAADEEHSLEEMIASLTT